MRVIDGGRHEAFSLTAGIAEHDALVASTFIFIAGSINAFGYIRRLLVNIAIDVGFAPIEARLLVTDIPDDLARGLNQILGPDRGGTAHLASENDAVCSGECL